MALTESSGPCGGGRAFAEPMMKRDGSHQHQLTQNSQTDEFPHWIRTG
jgi:hypothetical protein